MADEIVLKRWSIIEIVAIILLTCGIGAVYLGFLQYKALKQVNPEALDAVVAIALEVLGLILTAGVLSVVVQYVQTKRLVDVGERVRHPGRNHNLMLIVMGAHVAGLLSVWGSWTGFLALAAFGFEVYAVWTFQKELELYTVPG